MPGEITRIEVSMCLSCMTLVDNRWMEEPGVCRDCAIFKKVFKHRFSEDDVPLYESTDSERKDQYYVYTKYYSEDCTKEGKERGQTV